MTKKNQDIQDQILLKALEDVPFDGWTWDVVEQAAVNTGYGVDMASAVFPDKLPDVLRHFSQWADRQMMQALEAISPGEYQNMRVRDKVKQGVLSRIEVLKPHKESVKAASAFWLRPFRKMEAGKMVWKTADQIWIWAGDNATDYNHYTKRLLLSGVITSTMLAWMNDTSDNSQETLDFLDRRIDNVLGVGKIIGNIKGRFKGHPKEAKGAS